MKKLKIVFFFIAGLFICSCTKVISVNLNDASPNIVIEGVVNNNPGPYQVKISQTVNFSDPNVFPPVVGATVTITDSTSGLTDLLIENSPGTYTTQILPQGRSGHTYQLSVSVNGQTFTASSTMPNLVAFDSLTFYSSSTFGTDRTNAVANFQDPASVANYYTFTEYVNGRQNDQTFNFSDRLSDGLYIRRQLFNDSTYIQSGSTVNVDMHCVDQAVWSYFNTLGQAKGNNSQSVSPANPVSNISNKALGYFSAQTTQSKQAFFN
ncbi:MAG TPA: DUF4249 domain-containing protein [Puia sp.]